MREWRWMQRPAPCVSVLGLNAAGGQEAKDSSRCLIQTALDHNDVQIVCNKNTFTIATPLLGGWRALLARTTQVQISFYCRRFHAVVDDNPMALVVRSRKGFDAGWAAHIAIIANYPSLRDENKSLSVHERIRIQNCSVKFSHPADTEDPQWNHQSVHYISSVTEMTESEKMLETLKKEDCFRAYLSISVKRGILFSWEEMAWKVAFSSSASQGWCWVGLYEVAPCHTLLLTTGDTMV